MTEYTKNIPLRLFFAFLFVILPYIVAHIIPTSLIYHWKENPIKMDKQVFETCEPITWTLQRKSLIPFRATVTERIIDGSPVIDRSYRAVVMPTKEYKTVKVSWNNICLVPDYYNLEGLIEFDLMGITKKYPFRSYIFEVR